MKPTRQLAKYLAGLGYGTRKELERAIDAGRLTGEGAAMRFDGAALDVAPGFVLMLNKPVGYTCSHKDAGRLVYDLLPPRFVRRSPAVSSVGRLDAETSGLLLFTDDGQLLHRLISPKSALEKVYEVTLARPLHGHEAEIFARGDLMLESETTPLKPAVMQTLGACTARLTLTEGRYHQVRRMFAAVGNHVAALHRSRFGAMQLGDLAEGTWRLLDAGDRARLAQK
jgi:16S rRNA pseudouridine516 synthase